ncbi:hypothetical protein [Leptospira bouyouniensis]|uniref:Uncharacterized protein n=1 Tax=Leptospira bouyouniensis TaxID=2484911 RepID=A0ABY2KZ38_9LEPT|nr:hypothetical protein [Leptospira bouyouniensis]TGK45521.1 hypothetical protein EHQ10_18920 [Leptospira bouyouniensis]
MINRILEIYRGDTYRGDRGLIFEDIPNLHLPSTTVQFSVKKNPEDEARVISFPINGSDPGNDWSEPVRRIVVNLETGHTQLLEGGIYFYDIEINYSGEIITAASGEFIVIPDIAKTVHVVSPTTEASIYSNLASNLESLGASLVGVVSLFWDTITGSPNGTVESILRFLWNNKINGLSTPSGNRLLKSTTDGNIIQETNVSISNEGDVSGIRDLTLGRDLFVPGKIVSQGNLIEGDVIQVKDKNIELGKVVSPDEDSADGGGISLLGTTNKTFQWLKAKSAWVSSESIELPAGKNFLLNGIEYVLSKILSFPGSTIPGRVLSSNGSGLIFIDPPSAPVTSVNGETGAIDLSDDYYDKGEINTALSSLSSEISNKQNISEKGMPNGYAPLNMDSKLPNSFLDIGFLNLKDTPSSFSGQKSKVVKVKSDESGLEFGSANETNNYIDFPNAIGDPVSQLGWVKYNDGSTPPTNGGVGGGGLGLLSFNNVNYNAEPDFYYMTSEVGYGVSKEFTISNVHKNSILEISFDFITTNNCETNIYVYDIGKSQLIHPVNNRFIEEHPFVNIHRQGRFSCQFQTSTSLTYRLLIHTKSLGDSSSYFKNFRIWTPNINHGSIITEWESYSPTFSNFGNSPSSSLYWRRNGQNLEIKGRITAGTSIPSLVGSFSAPNGLVFDSTICATTQQVGFAIRNIGTANQSNILALGGESVFKFSAESATNGLTPQNLSLVFNDSQVISINLSVPIQGWGGTVQLSSQTGDGRTVTGLVVDHTSQSMTSGTTDLKFNTVIRDTHGAYNTSTGGITIPVAGDYSLTINFPYQTTSSNEFRAYKNGTIMDVGGFWLSSGYTSATLFLANLKVGDVITVRPSGFSPTTSSNSTKATNISWNLIAGGYQVFAKEEFIGASYYSSSTQTTLTSQINFGAKIYDTHGAVTTGASWKFTAPQNGYYQLALRISGSGNIQFTIFKNNSSFLSVARTETPGYATGTRVFYLLAGDYLDVRPGSSGTVNGHVTASSIDASSIEITKVS